MGRTIWVVRHAAREDANNPNWLHTTNPHKLKFDNTPLSARGLIQAQELAERFRNVPIDFVFASPYDRTMDTATRMLSLRANKIPIKVEPGFAEVLHCCRDSPEPGFEDMEILKAKYPLVDTEYKPVYTKQKLAEMIASKEEPDDYSVTPRVVETVYKILEYKKGMTCGSSRLDTEGEGSILIVTHGSPVNAIHQALLGQWEWGATYVGQATVSKIVEFADSEDRDKEIPKFYLEFSGDASHLSDNTNL